MLIAKGIGLGQIEKNGAAHTMIDGLADDRILSDLVFVIPNLFRDQGFGF